MRRKTLLAALVVLLLGAVLLGVVLYRGRGREDPGAPLAPDASTAPAWPGPTPIDGEPSPQRTPYHWPADFKLPREITIEDLPEVPPHIIGPSPPIDDEAQ